MEHKRIKVIPKNPNPLFKKWLKEWIEEAEKKNKIKLSKIYERALNSLNKYPLTLFCGHDCAILECFGPKICQMLDEKLEQHLNGRLDLFQQKSYKEKISEVQRREVTKISELVKSVEAAILTDTTFACETTATLQLAASTMLDDIQEDDEIMEISAQNDDPLTEDHRIDHCIDHHLDIENLPPNDDVEIPEELLSSSAEEETEEDSFQRLLKKYDPEMATQKKQTTKKLTKKKENIIKRQKIDNSGVQNDVVDLSLSPKSSPVLPLNNNSPVSTLTKGGTRFKKHRTFDSGRISHLAGPSYASSPISKFLDVELINKSPASPFIASNHFEDSFDRLVAKNDFVSPIIAKPISPIKIGKKPATKKLKTINEVLRDVPATKSQFTVIQSVPDDDEDEIKYTLIDEITPQDYNVLLLVDIAETSG